jgi:hypothetical protein
MKGIEPDTQALANGLVLEAMVAGVLSPGEGAAAVAYLEDPGARPGDSIVLLCRTRLASLARVAARVSARAAARQRRLDRRWKRRAAGELEDPKHRRPGRAR